MWWTLRGAVKRSGNSGVGIGLVVLGRAGEGVSKRKIVLVFSVVNSGWNSEIILFWEKSIGRGMSCIRTGESWYLADDGGGRENSGCGHWKHANVSSDHSVHPASWWTQALGEWESLCSALGSQWAWMNGGRNEWKHLPPADIWQKCKDLVFLFLHKGFHIQFLPVLLFK